MKPPTELKLDLARQAVHTCACFNLRRASRAVTLVYDEALAPLGLSSGQYVLLLAVRLRGETSLLQLADMVWTDRSVLSRTVRPLEERGFLKIVPGRDRRIRKVTLSPQGHRALLAAHACWQRTQLRMTKVVGAARLDRLIDTLDQTLRTMEPKKKRSAARRQARKPVPVPVLRRRAA